MIGTTISHYRIDAQLGHGGMGTVYRAIDTRLGRIVAVKFLRPDLSNRADVLERFKREARAISALNHQGICTLYDIGNSDSGPFLTMEYVDGQTISELLGANNFSNMAIIDVAMQVADALDAAHSAGLVHRDIKPSNIMLTSRGQAKLLDFGIAKALQFAYPSSSDNSTLTDTVTIAEDLTADGSITGTLRYMSPEQIRGGHVDARSDIFALGATLYEMATRKAAFTGETPTQIMASILEKQPVPPAEIVPNVSAGLNEVILTALEKDIATRYQSAADLRAALMRMKRQHASPPSTPAAGKPRRGWRKPLIAAASLVLISAVTIAGYRTLQLRSLPKFEQITMSRLTSSGTAVTSAISPDGRYLAYAADEDGKQALRIRQVATSSEVVVSTPADAQYRRLAFSPDGNMLYYNVFSAGLFAVPALGGTPKLLNRNVDSAVTFSPDGKQIAFQRRYPRTKESSILIAQADGTGERKITTRTDPSYFLGGVTWSPDGKTLACTAGMYSPTGQYTSLVAISLPDGVERSMTDKKWFLASDPRWLHHGRGVIVQAADKPFSPAQIWYIPYPRGTARRITNDLNNYTGVALTADSSAFVTVQLERISNIWVSNAGENSQPVRVTSGGAALDGFTGMAWTPDGRIVYGSRAGGEFDIWIMHSDGTNRTQLTRDSGVNAQPRVSPDGRYIVFTSDRKSGKPHIWRMDLNGDNPKQLTDGTGEHVSDCCIDGKWVVFATLGGTKLLRAPLDGGPAESIANMVVRTPVISPDSRYVAFNYFGAPDPPHRGVAVVDAHGGQIERRFPIRNDDASEPHVGFRPMLWRNDSRALMFLRDSGNVSNIWAQPLNASQPVQLSRYNSGRIFGFATATDGQRLALAKGSVTSDVLLIRNTQ